MKKSEELKDLSKKELEKLKEKIIRNSNLDIDGKAWVETAKLRSEQAVKQLGEVINNIYLVD